MSMRNEERKRRLKKLSLVLGVLILVFGSLYALYTLVLQAKVTNFQVSANNLTCTDSGQITQFLRENSINYFSINQEKMNQDLRDKFFCISRANFKATYPDKLAVEVWGREGAFIVTEITTSGNINPVVLLPETLPNATESTAAVVPVKLIDDVLKEAKTSSQSATFLVDNEGMVFDQVNAQMSFPRISILGIKLEIGRMIPDNTIEKVKQVTQKLTVLGIPTDNLYVLADKLIIDSKPRVIISLNKRLDYQTASLQLILTQAKMNSDPLKQGSGDIESIDLRFDKPVVKYGK